MIFTDFKYITFLFLVFVIHWSLKGNFSRKVFLLIISYTFYAFWDWRFLGLIFFSTIVDYFSAKKIHKSKQNRKKWLVLSLISNLGVLAFFKYFNFFIENAQNFFSSIGIEASLSTLEIILPVGISFYTFQTLSYTIDVYKKNLNPENCFISFSLYVAFFPQLVAGPIVRARDMLPQLRVSRCFSNIPWKFALIMFTLGFIKKTAIADNLAIYVDAYFLSPSSFDLLSSWVAIHLFLIQLYCDFSGYTDMAIASSALLGYRLPKNFDFPLFSKNIVQFWKKWHISLSGWFRDYLYIPLTQMKKFKSKSYGREIAILVTMTITGFWHGASWNFLIFGLMHGVSIVICHMLITPFTQNNPSRIYNLPLFTIACYFFTFSWVSISTVFFRAKDLSSAIEIFGILIGAYPSGSESSLPLSLVITAVSLLAVIHYVFKVIVFKTNNFETISWQSTSIILGLLWPLVLSFNQPGVERFVYFQF